MAVLTDLKNHGVADVLFVVCDGLKGLPNSVNAVWPNNSADVHHPPDPWHVPVRLAKELAGACPPTNPSTRRLMPRPRFAARDPLEAGAVKTLVT
jgi:hypothetical protein